MKLATLNPFRSLDWALLLLVTLLCTFSVIFSYSTQIQIYENYDSKFNLSFKYIRQLFYFASGLVLMWAISLVNYRKIADLSEVLFYLSILLLGYTLLSGEIMNQSKRWISLGFLTGQPSEFVKIVMIVFAANYLDKRLPHLNYLKELPLLFFWISVPFLLILLQPDLGTALVFVPVFVAMLLAARVKLKFFLSLLLVFFIAAAVPLLYIYAEEVAGAQLLVPADRAYLLLLAGFFLVLASSLFCANLRLQNLFLRNFSILNFLMALGLCLGVFIESLLLKQYQRERLFVFLNPEEHRWGAGYNVLQSQITIGSGELWGKGIFNGTQGQLGFLPSRSTDFIFSIIGEETGFFGAMLLLLLFFLFFWRLAYIALNVKDYLGGLICIGILTLFFVQTFVNIAMTIGLLPVTGLPLPFVSAGGSTLWSSMIATGLVCSVYRYRRVYLEEEKRS